MFAIFGTGRQAEETFDILEDLGVDSEVVCFVVDSEFEMHTYLGKPVMSTTKFLEKYRNSDNKPLLNLALGNTKIVKQKAIFFTQNAFDFFNVICSEVNTRRVAKIGTGVTIAQGVVLTTNISIGSNSLINIGCTISHDCVIGSYVNISPGCHLAGGVIVENEVFIGAGVTIIPNIRIGKGAVVAAGSTIIKDVAPYTMVAGVPAIKKKSIS